MRETTISKLENGTDLTVVTAVDQPGFRACTREHRYASLKREQGTPSVDLTINLADGGETFYVRWNWNRGNAWSKAHRRSGFATEQAAREWAEGKWQSLLAWLTTCEPRPAAPISLYL